MSANETKLVQPYHFTVKTYAQRYDGKVPFSVEVSVHLSMYEIDEIENENGAIQTGLKKIIKMYTDLGYAHVAELDADVKPVKK